MSKKKKTRRYMPMSALGEKLPEGYYYLVASPGTRGLDPAHEWAEVPEIKKQIKPISPLAQVPFDDPGYCYSSNDDMESDFTLSRYSKAIEHRIHVCQDSVYRYVCNEDPSIILAYAQTPSELTDAEHGNKTFEYKRVGFDRHVHFSWQSELTYTLNEYMKRDYLTGEHGRYHYGFCRAGFVGMMGREWLRLQPGEYTVLKIGDALRVPRR